MTTEQRQRWLFILTGAALAILLTDWFVVTPLLKAWDDRSARMVQLDESLLKGEILLDRQTAIRERWTAMRKHTLPDSPAAAESELLKAFDRWSQDSGISVTSLKPQWRAREDQSLGLECRADGFGDMSALARFLYELESDPMALRVDYVEITAHDNTGERLGFGLQVTGLLLPSTSNRSQP